MGFNLIDQFCLIVALGQKYPDQLHHFIAAENEPGVAAAGIEFGQFLAQQRQQQAYRE